MVPRIDSLLFQQFGAEEAVAGLLLAIALIVSATLGLGRRAFYGAIAVILAVTTTYIYFHANQELAATILGPRDELEAGAFAIQMWLKACRLFGLATIGGLLATILFQAKHPTNSASVV